MCSDALVEEFEGGYFVGLISGDAEDGVPAAFNCEPADAALCGELAVEFGEVSFNACENLSLNSLPLADPLGERALNGRVHGEECVSDDFKARDGLMGIRAGGDEPSCFHLRERRDFAKATDDEAVDA